jgi:hypothetical protein
MVVTPGDRRSRSTSAGVGGSIGRVNGDLAVCTDQSGRGVRDDFVNSNVHVIPRPPRRIDTFADLDGGWIAFSRQSGLTGDTAMFDVATGTFAGTVTGDTVPITGCVVWATDRRRRRTHRGRSGRLLRGSIIAVAEGETVRT